MNYTVSHIAQIIEASGTVVNDMLIEHLLLDSRRINAAGSSLFFALRGPRRDGHQFIPELYKKGIRNFVVSEPTDITAYPDAVFLLVKNTLSALQQLAAWHRRQFHIPVIGITGSNGKTIVKEWLYQLLQQDHHIVRSPKSFNSQIGVPLSIWNMQEQHTLAIFEAGISQAGEMERLAYMIQPTLGVLTNIGEAHSEGFNDKRQKLQEKLKLFDQAAIIVYNADDVLTNEEMQQRGKKNFSWGVKEGVDLRIISVKKTAQQTTISCSFKSLPFDINIPFTDGASIENAITSCCVLLYMGVLKDTIRERMQHLQPVNMRLELKKGINHCAVINDSYSADLSSLEMALNFLDQQSGRSGKTVILSDFLQTSQPDEQLYASILVNLKKHGVSRLIGIGERIAHVLGHLITQPDPELATELYSSTGEYLQQFRSSRFREETILVKGARVFGFEQIVQLLEQKVHQTLLEINLNAIVHNLKEYQQQLQPSTKVMAMVKAFAYGSGGAEIAGILEFHKVDYLGVAYADEGVELRRAGVSLPVMVMNPEETVFDTMIDHNLEPEIYSFELLHALDAFLQREGIQQYPVHIEIETGMNRLGFDVNDMKKLGDLLTGSVSFKVQTVFSHLAASEEAAQDEFTLTQYARFEKAAAELKEKLGYSFLRHIANSAAILRHPQLQLDMVRLGIGMYGVDNSGLHKADLQTVATLKSTIAQLKQVKTGESVSYNRKGKVERDSVIATVRLGYADGYPRRLGNGIGKMYIHGKLAPVIGTVCMDMTMIDVTGIPGVAEGDDVIIFGKELGVQQLAEWAGTIPYEIMTGISQRVKRIYFEE